VHLPTRTLLAVAAVAVLGLTACGDDDDDDAAAGADEPPAAPASDTGTDAYCAASLAFESAPQPEIDFESATEEEIAAGMKAYASDVLQPAMADIVATAPDELADEAEQFTALVDEFAATGDPSAFETPEVAAITATAHAYDLTNCGWESVDVAATDYAFAGLPAELDAGVVSLEMRNHGEELHELLLLRKNDGVTETAEEILALTEEEGQVLTTTVGTSAFAAPGAEDFLVAELEPGNYVAVCFVPVGATSTDGPPPDGPPHAMEGMYTEFTVT
jgi:hypothetical protein